MAAEPPQSDHVQPAGSFWPIAVRWIVAAILAVGVLYLWCRLLMTWVGFGWHPVVWPWCFGIVAGVALLIGLAAWSGRHESRGGWTAPRLWALGAVWSLASVAVWQLTRSPFSQDVSISIGYAAATWWLLWTWLMFLVGWHWPRRLGLLAVFALTAAIFVASVRANGWDGAARPDVVWRFRAAAPLAAADPTPVQAVADALPMEQTSAYPRFRGADGLATVRGAHLARTWSRQKPVLLWRHGVGAAWSAIAVAGGQAITQEQRGDDECVVSYDRRSGAEQWVHRDPAHYKNPGTGDGPRATPTIDAERVFTLGATGILNCLDCASGRRHWTVNILTDNEATAPGHGTVGSPLVAGQLVIVCAGGAKDASVVAYDKTTGKRVWGAGSEPAGYTSPLLVERAGAEQVLAVSTQSLTAHHPSTGEILWSFPWRNDQATNCSQPFPVHASDVFISANYGSGCALLEITAGAAGRWEAKPKWTSRVMQTKFCSVVIHEGHAYSFDDEVLECVSMADGRRRWKHGRYGHGQLLLADSLLVIQAEDGRVVLVEATPQEHRELAAFQAIDGKTWNNPALAGRQLFVRNDHEAACYELPAEEP